MPKNWRAKPRRTTKIDQKIRNQNTILRILAVAVGLIRNDKHTLDYTNFNACFSRMLRQLMSKYVVFGRRVLNVNLFNRCGGFHLGNSFNHSHLCHEHARFA